MTWLDLGGATVLAVALLMLPGLPMAAVAGARGAWLVAASIPLSVTTIGTAAIAASFVGMSWSVVAVALVAVVATAAAVGIRLLLRRWWGPAPSSTGLVEVMTLLAALVGTVVLATRLARSIGQPDNFSQTYDGVFHLNAVRWILDQGDGSPQSISEMGGSGAGTYPVGFHDVASLVASLTNVPVPGAVNATWLAFAAVVWPLGAVLLTRALIGTRRAALLAAGALSTGIAAFPILLVDYGVLYPLLAGYAVLPIVLAMGLRACRLSVEDTARPVPWAVMAVVALPGLALLHPTALVSWLVLATPAVLIALFAVYRRGHQAPAVGAAAVWLVGSAAVLLQLRPSFSGSSWAPFVTAGQAVGEALTLSAYQGPIIFLDVYRGAVPVVATLLFWGGLVVVVRSRDPQRAVLLLAGPVTVAALYVVAASFEHGQLRYLLTGAWFSNSPRIAALLPLVCIPVAALAAMGLVDQARRVPRLGGWARRSPRGLTVVSLIAVAGLTLALQSNAVRLAYADVNEVFEIDADAPLVTADEAALIDRLPELVPEGVMVAGSPFTGTAMAYALADRPVLYPHLNAASTDDVAVVAAQLRSAEPGSEVCEAVDRLDVGFVLDFGTQEVQYFDNHRYPGLEDLETSNAVELVAEEGEARLYEVTACQV